MSSLGYRIVRYCDVDIYYLTSLDGGGREFGQDYLRIVPMLRKRPRSVFEWCAGPGFIGFSLLAHGLCDRLCLADINPVAVATCRRTVEANGLNDRVTIYHSDCLDSIPPQERWDLVVGNPPHSGTDTELPWGDKLIYMDVGWRLHLRFWRRIHEFVSPGGVVLVQENAALSQVGDFADMVEDNRMRICYVAHVGPLANVPIYYIGAVRAEDAPRHGIFQG